MTLSTPHRSHAAQFENRRPLDNGDREAEQALLARFADFWGSAQGELRAIYDTFIGDTPVAEDVTFKEVDAERIRGWWIRQSGAGSDRTILYLHGGGYVIGSAAAYRSFASQIAKRANISTFVLDYPLAPEHQSPAALDNAALARRWLSNQGARRIAIAGDSAGDGLTLATLRAGLGHGFARLVGSAVFSPWTDLVLTGASIIDKDGLQMEIARGFEQQEEQK